MATSDVVKETLNVAGLSTNVYTRANFRDKRTSDSEPVVVLFFLHGRTESADQVDPTARAAFSWQSRRKLLQERHPGTSWWLHLINGTTERGRWINEGTLLGARKRINTTNVMRNVDLYSTLVGAVKDISFLIDVLPSYIFPHDERVIGEWVLAGFSLGGHATWLGLTHEPRIRIGIPICACPDLLTLMEQRAEKHGVPRSAPYFPESLRALVRVYDPVAAPRGAFAGKRILALAGADDSLVPWSASRAFVEALDVGERGMKKTLVLPGVKHECTDEMREELFRFFWEEALVIRQGGTRNSAL